MLDLKEHRRTILFENRNIIEKSMESTNVKDLCFFDKASSLIQSSTIKKLRKYQ